MRSCSRDLLPTVCLRSLRSTARSLEPRDYRARRLADYGNLAWEPECLGVRYRRFKTEDVRRHYVLSEHVPVPRAKSVLWSAEPTQVHPSLRRCAETAAHSRL